MYSFKQKRRGRRRKTVSNKKCKHWHKHLLEQYAWIYSMCSCSLKMPHLFYHVYLFANELPMNIIPSIQSIYPKQPPHTSSSSSFLFCFCVYMRWSNRRVTIWDISPNLLQTHLHNVWIVYRNSHSRNILTHTDTQATPSYVSFFTNERYICKLNFDMFVLTINLEWTFTVANQSGNQDTT